MPAKESIIRSLHLPVIKRTSLLAGFLLVFGLLPAASSTSAFFERSYQPLQPDPAARALFTQTYQQLRRGELTDLSEVLTQLQHYPLAPYLEYQLFRNQLAYKVANHEKIQAFLALHSDKAFQSTLRHEWLEELARQQNWPLFLQQADNASITSNRLTCFRLQAEAEVFGTSLSWLETTADFWRNNQPLPGNCKVITEKLHLLGLLKPDDYRTAALQLMQNGQTSQARALHSRLKPADQQWLDYWQKGRQNPAAQLQALLNNPRLLRTDTTLREEILLDLLKNHARTHPTRTEQLIGQLRNKKLLSDTSGWQVQEYIAIRAAQRNRDNSLELFAKVPAAARSAQGQEWYARTLLRAADWARLHQAILQLPDELQANNEWRYWLAHTLIEQQQPHEANQLLQQLAEERSYYGFLAARSLGIPPRMNELETPINPPVLQQLSQQQGMIRSGELYFTGFVEDANREWFQALRGASTEDWIQAGWLARHWGWHDRSVDAANRAGLHDALDLRFPLAHLETLRPLAQQAGLELPLVLALIRKESLFNPQARSSVGALGLMQVMPATGRQVSNQLRMSLKPETDLLLPEHNLPVGVHYLSGLMRRYDNNPILAASAYNAGPSRANSWRNSLGQETDPLWVERITFAETRDYVKSLLAFSEVYAWRLQQEQERQAQLDSLQQPEG
ncbi:MAG: lytic transglycosylase domain-containing protein [Marinospirillum sp.]|uniref:lytic transglycosylase domain-containing protein n=1 Tax=Marinospirillum sp. TaxID=2183934 RepID=UPI001A0ED150|nr:lytic transglycosylase domain-containing protein [Marinospirillum sp.]MBE0505325.1 lytic transglycosylase domain-containing protein [Marinospirillum sp.]